ncbi:ficolin-1 [Plakobranchus ocellatus]|uniref:Ficolin-1 n=1 Tax=Plakobranchus ocellatus TaxID=259542 RepID=A0AAV4DEM7_9GAST|nr:ficolin-1 [Plakobranchus ocellatus]
MKSELFTNAALILLCFNACCEGIKLILNRDIQVMVGSRITCGILLCEEKLTQTYTTNSSVFKMTVFKNQPSCSRTPEDESRVFVASINAKQRNISRITDATRAFGNLGRRNASLRIEMFKHDDCSSDFTCEVQGLDSQGRSFLSTTTLLQQQGDDHMGYEILANSLGELKDKIESKIESAFRGVRNQVHSLENRMDSLENRMENKIDAKLSAIKNQIHLLEERMYSLEHRIEDKIDAKLSAIKNDDTQIMSSIDNIIKEALDKIHSILYAIKGQFRQLVTSMVTTLEPYIVDILQPSTCNRDMIIPFSPYPNLHPVIYPRDESGQGLPYLCDMITDGGGWIVIQRRSTLFNVDFYRDWATYKKGFGTFDGEFWLGNERIHAFTSIGTWELRVDLKYKGKEAYALYSNFKVESESKQYILRIGTYSGTAGDSLTLRNGQKFSTRDRDNDRASKKHCAQRKKGGWWYNYCAQTDLNSKKTKRQWTGIIWDAFAGKNSCSFSEMKMRRVA